MDETSYKLNLQKVEFNMMINVTQCLDNIKIKEKKQVEDEIVKLIDNVNNAYDGVDVEVKRFSKDYFDEINGLNDQWKKYNENVSLTLHKMSSILFTISIVLTIFIK